MANAGSARYSITVSGLAELEAALNNTPYRHRVIKNVLTTIAAATAANAAKRVRKKTKATAQSINFQVFNEPLMAVIGVHNPAGLFLEKGARAHIIAARNAQALMLPIRGSMSRAQEGSRSPFGRTYGKKGSSRLTGSVRSGQVAFFKSVHHPGNKPYPFLIPAYRDVSITLLDAILLKAGAQIVAAMARKGELTGL